MVLTIDLGAVFFAKFMLTFDLGQKRLFLQNGEVPRSKVNMPRSKVNTFFLEKIHQDQRSPPSLEGGDL